jgi:ribosome-associated protein
MSKKTISAPAKIEPDLDGLNVARQCVWAAQEKKALDPIILDLRSISTITDYLVICSAQSEPQIKAIANGVEQALKEGLERHPLAVDGFPTSQWIVIDYGDVMFHIFHEQKRGVYALEDLWSDAPQVSTLEPT